MGRHHGTYVRYYLDVTVHPKTLRLAEALVALKFPRRGAVREAVGQLMQLAGWCALNTEDGRLDHLPAILFARAVGWDDDRTAEGLLSAWRVSGFLDVLDDGRVYLHEFDEFAEDLLAARAERQRKRESYRRARGLGVSAESPRRNSGSLRGECADVSAEKLRKSPRTSHARVGAGARVDAPVRPATTTTTTHTQGGVCEEITEDPNRENTEPQAETRGDDSTRPTRGRDFADDPDGHLLAAWNAARAKRSLPPDCDGPKVREAWTALLTAVESAETLALATIAAYYAITDPYVVEAGYSVAVFPFRLAACVASARESMRRRARSNGKAQVASEPEEAPLPAAEARQRMAALPWKRGARSEEEVLAENARRAEAAERVRAEVAGGG